MEKGRGWEGILRLIRSIRGSLAMTTAVDAVHVPYMLLKAIWRIPYWFIFFESEALLGLEPALYSSISRLLFIFLDVYEYPLRLHTNYWRS